ncbi:FKBP-type peptidyl-prolyl cis-trans isomerase [Sanguibacter antarcticus]|uniref:FKBP-type peptidyl-prolyl cis-trans isomerase n=1 Tax=Sanguibacter antarcticus TaxID=372484 RepID=UPI0014736882|nr:FKBP-type peptidyl-prolyl cis-trans isomerase [Sanguibacter antarcticus]
MTACGPSPEPVPTPTVAPAPVVDISGTGGQAPVFTYTAPLLVETPLTEVVWTGDGEPVVDNQPVLLKIYSENATDATVVRDDFASLPKPYLLSPESIGSDLYTVISGQTIGTRILHVVETDDVPLVMSIDILSSRAVGEARAPADGLPTVEYDANGVPTVSVAAEAVPPTSPVVQQLIRGTGAQITAGQKVMIQFVAVKWSNSELFDTTWGADLLPETVTLGEDQLIEGFDEGLVDLPIGSQVMLVIPPGLGFGPSGNDLSAETLVYVVDILAASPAA